MKKGVLCVVGCYILWGLLPLFWKLLAAVDSLYILGCRIVWSLVFIALLLAFRNGRFAGVRAALRDKKERTRLIMASVAICVNWGLYIWAVANDHMLDSSLAYYMNPILAILLGTLVFREKHTRLQWLAVAVAFTGIIIAVVRYRQIPWIALIIGTSFAVYGAFKKKVYSDAATSTFVETMVLTPFFLIFMGWMEWQGRGAIGVLHGWQWLLLPMAGVVTSIPVLLYSEGMRTTSMSLSGILMYINPTLQLLLSVWLYHEEFTATHAILFAFVWSGLVLYLLSGFLRERKKEDAPCA